MVRFIRYGFRKVLSFQPNKAKMFSSFQPPSTSNKASSLAKMFSSFQPPSSNKAKMFSSFQPPSNNKAKMTSNNDLMENLANEIAGVRKEIKHVEQDLRKEIEFVRK